MAGGQEAAAVEDPGEKKDDHAMFEIGDVVMGVATKAKEKWAQKCEIVDILSKHYKVKMLEGTEIGTVHKFLHACVKRIEIPAPDAANAAGQLQRRWVK